MKLDGFGLFVEDMGNMIRFYKEVLGFKIKESEDTSNVYLFSVWKWNVYSGKMGIIKTCGEKFFEFWGGVQNGYY